MSDDTIKAAPSRRTPRKRGTAKVRNANAAKPKSGGSTDTTSRPSASTATAHDKEQASPRQHPSTNTLAVIPLHVRWRDLDAFNHVNNSSYLTYLEESRLQWLRGVPGEWFNAHAMPVMAAVELHYRKPIEWPAEIDVLLSCERLGNSSMTVGNCIVDRNDHACVYADGNVVMVWVDPATGTSVPLPDAIRQACS